MNDFKSIGAESTFKSPKGWIFKPVRAFRFKIYFLLILNIIFILAIILTINLLRNRMQYLTALIISTATMFIYLWLSVVALHIYFNSIEYQVHGTEIVIKKGLFNITENHIPFSNITNIAIRQGIFDRLFGIGTVIAYTGGAKLNSKREMGQIRGTRIFADVAYFVLNQIKDYETFFTYMLGENTHAKTKLDNQFWSEFLMISKDIRNLLEE